jgi:hypothetical protein
MFGRSDEFDPLPRSAAASTTNQRFGFQSARMQNVAVTA